MVGKRCSLRKFDSEGPARKVNLAELMDGSLLILALGGLIGGLAFFRDRFRRAAREGVFTRMQTANRLC